MARRKRRRRSSGQLGFWGGRKKKVGRDAVVTVKCNGKGSYSVVGTRREVEKVAGTVDRHRCTTKISKL